MNQKWIVRVSKQKQTRPDEMRRHERDDADSSFETFLEIQKTLRFRTRLKTRLCLACLSLLVISCEVEATLNLCCLCLRAVRYSSVLYC